ncbi:Uncharacterized conserved protein [Arboricoccus pini]|uniref:Uncharacterized conserved protein n=1 Tax=Arboricoccus pini TaxID=1963835 RepID=A0A212QPS9_9PROT|nr:hypothetical protein [Arboricoccus pini]SNB61443.1 Uncharacterized conserved protein [Arboricoccus pini]
MSTESFHDRFAGHDRPSGHDHAANAKERDGCGQAVDLEGLKARIRAIEGGGGVAHRVDGRPVARLGAPIDRALPWNGLPTMALHEVAGPSATAVTAGMARRFLDRKGALVWCRSDGLARLQGELYGPGLRPYGIDPARLIHIRARDAEETFWAASMAMRSQAVACTVVETEAFDLVTSRRLQIALESGGGAGLVLRHGALESAPNAALTRFWAEPMPRAILAADDPAPWRLRPRGPSFRLSLWRAKGAQPSFWTVSWNERTLAFDLASPLVPGAVAKAAEDGQSFART